MAKLSIHSTYVPILSTQNLTSVQIQRDKRVARISRLIRCYFPSAAVHAHARNVWPVSAHEQTLITRHTRLINMAASVSSPLVDPRFLSATANKKNPNNLPIDDTTPSVLFLSGERDTLDTRTTASIIDEKQSTSFVIFYFRCSRLPPPFGSGSRWDAYR